MRAADSSFSTNLEAAVPRNAAARTRWIEAQRGAKAIRGAHQPYAWLHETEPDLHADPVPTNTIFLTNAECPWRCLMCDLWQNTLAASTPAGAIPAQIEFALQQLPPGRQVKLYNSGSFFDTRAVPVTDYMPVANLLAGIERVVVECHPALIGERTWRFRDMISGRLEVAMGLETVHERTLQMLNKRMTVAAFGAAATRLLRADIDLRVFILLRPPGMTELQGVHWACRSLDAAFDMGAAICSLIPTRPGNGAMEALEHAGAWSAPSIDSLETALEYGLSLRRGRVFADLWDIERFYRCSCSPERAARITTMNNSQQIPAPIVCSVCANVLRG